MIRTWLGRRINVLALWLGLAALVQATVLLPTPWQSSIQSRFLGPVAWAGGLWALATSAVLLAGWVRRSDRLRRNGLWMSCGTWLWIAMVAFSAASPVSGVNALIWAGLAGTSAWAEQTGERR